VVKYILEKTFASNGRELTHISSIELSNNMAISLPDKATSYIEMKDRIVVLILFPTQCLPEKEEDIYRNIFCYSKTDGSLLWQIEHYDVDGEIIEDVFVGMSVLINKEEKNEEWYTTTLNKEIKAPSFVPERDSFTLGTFEGCRYELDPLTGKIKFIIKSK